MKPHKSHLVGEPKTRTLCGLGRISGKKLLPIATPPTITCANCIALYYGEPKTRVWHSQPPIPGVPF